MLKPLSSAITISPAAPRAPIGRPAGANGSVVAPASSLARLPPAVRRASTSAADDSVLARLRSSLGSAPTLRRESVSGSDGQFESTAIAGVDIPDAVTPAQASAALAELADSPEYAPAGPQIASAALARIRALTAHRAQGDADLRASAAAYIGELAKFPRDVVEGVADRWPRISQWWPSWYEIQVQIDRAMAPRRAIWRALEDRAKKQ